MGLFALYSLFHVFGHLAIKLESRSVKNQTRAGQIITVTLHYCSAIIFRRNVDETFLLERLTKLGTRKSEELIE
jgi:hypothetical protein